jgi:hypothetical protein
LRSASASPFSPILVSASHRSVRCLQRRSLIDCLRRHFEHPITELPSQERPILSIYLYGMPIQQTMIHLFPSIRNPAAQACLALPAIFLFALFFWNVIEKPITKLRKKFSFIATVRGADNEIPNFGSAIITPASDHITH